MSPVFRHGRLRLYLLKLLDESPRHGYEVIRLLQDRFMGVYAPSPGTIYPRLARLEEDGLVTHEEVDGKKVYSITDKGREEIRSRLGDLADLEDELTESLRDVARGISEDVRDTVRTIREELASAAREFRTDGGKPAGASGKPGDGAGGGGGRPARVAPGRAARAAARKPAASGTKPGGPASRCARASGSRAAAMATGPRGRAGPAGHRGAPGQTRPIAGRTLAPQAASPGRALRRTSRRAALARDRAVPARIRSVISSAWRSSSPPSCALRRSRLATWVSVP